jgi:NADPH2:quinone reductase
MRAVVTAPDSPGRLVTIERPAPTPTPGFAIVRVYASSINRGETRLVPARPDGWAPGQDVAGVIEAPAPDGGPPAGTRIVALADGGTWSELAAVPIERIAQLPDAVSFEVAAALPVAGLTALRAVRALGAVVGRKVLVTGARGGSGNIAAQLLRAAGATVTGLARGSFALDGVRVVNALGDADAFDGVIDTVGGDVLADALGHLTPHAKAVTFAGGAPAPISLATFKGVPATLEALFVYGAPGRFDEDLATLAQFVADGRLKPHIGRTFLFDDVNAGLEALNAGGIDGKVVLVRSV